MFRTAPTRLTNQHIPRLVNILRIPGSQRPTQQVRRHFTHQRARRPTPRKIASDWFYGRPMDHALRRSYATFSPASRSTTAVIQLLIGANALVFGAWYYGEQTANTALLRQLTDKFTLSLRNLKQNRYYVMLTSAFSHNSFVHIAFNMVNLWTFGTILGYMGVGGPSTLALCLVSGIAGSAAWAYHHAFIKPDPRQSHVFNRQVIRMKDLDTALGASGVVMGVGAAAACLAPFAPMNIMLIPINIPLWGVVALYFAVDTWYLNTGERIGHAAHIGGTVAGVAYYMLALRRFGGVSRLFSRRMR